MALVNDSTVTLIFEQETAVTDTSVDDNPFIYLSDDFYISDYLAIKYNLVSMKVKQGMYYPQFTDRYNYGFVNFRVECNDGL